MARKKATPRKKAKSNGSVISKEYAAAYEPDALAVRIKKTFMLPEGGYDRPAFIRWAKDNEVWVPRYGELNQGMQIMNVTNRLRGRVRNGHKIVWPTRKASPETVGAPT
jgi:hypothetical protein